jgi:hypothetical protein
MQSQVKSTTLLDQVVHYKNELIAPIRLEATRPDGSIKTSYTWFTLDVMFVIQEETEESYDSAASAIAIAKLQIDLLEARLNFGV